MANKALDLSADPLLYKKDIMTKSAVTIFSGLFVSAAIIIYSNYTLRYENLVEFYSGLELEILTILPYMQAAVVTALAVLAVWYLIPNLKTKFYTQILTERIIKLGHGDLISQTKVEIKDSHLKPLAKELRNSIGVLNHSFAHLKIINRQQWEYLQAIKLALVKEDCSDIKMYVAKMEENWDKIVEIEETIET